ncbi:MAG: hypothetical protein Fur006_01100 [Coleofasciculaceae cyanobacterium]
MSFEVNTTVVLFGGWGREATILKLNTIGYKIVAVVTPKDVTPKLQESINRIQEAGLNLISCSKSNLEDVLHPFTQSTLLSIGFPYLLSEEILKMFPLCLNVHPTLLPRYRGPTSGAYILINNEPESGSTVHLMDAGMDTGAIVLQRKVQLSRFDTIRSLRRKVYSLEPDLVVDALALLKTPGFQPIPQDESKSINYPKKRKPQDSEIDSNQSIAELFDTIRACDPDEFPAFFYIEGQKVCVRLWRPERPLEDEEDML